MKNIIATAVMVGVLFSLTASTSGQTLKTGYISKDLNYLPFFIAQKKGFHAKEGIAVDLVSIGRSDIQLQALVAGELHFANINADNIIIWNERTGGNLKVAAGSSNAAPYLLIGAKNIKKIEELRGRTSSRSVLLTSWTRRSPRRKRAGAVALAAWSAATASWLMSRR